MTAKLDFLERHVENVQEDKQQMSDLIVALTSEKQSLENRVEMFEALTLKIGNSYRIVTKIVFNFFTNINF
jgi:hypothetical protein